MSATVPAPLRPPPVHLGLVGGLWSGAMAALPLAMTGRMVWADSLGEAGRELSGALARADAAALGAAVAAEAERRFADYLAGVARYRSCPHRRRGRVWPERWACGSTRLRAHYPPAAGDDGANTVLLVPSLVNRSHILDLAPGRSLTRSLAGRGLSPLVVDWGAPGAEERSFTLAGYVTRRLEPALAAACAAAGGPVPVVGYCMGGLLALALALRRPDSVAALALLATPWDFHRGGPDWTPFLDLARPYLSPLIAGGGVLPPEPIQLLFAAAQPARIAAKFRAFARRPPDGAAAAAFVDVEDWLNDGVPLAGPVAHECLFGWYGDNRPGRGAWSLAGTRIDPAALSCPSLLLVPARDRVVPSPSALALARALPEPRVLRPRSGHIGMVVGRNARADCHIPLADWLMAVAHSSRALHNRPP